MNFEHSLLRLEEITQKLESGELSLDESLKIFEEGIKLSRLCEKKLTEAEQKLDILKSTDIDELLEKDTGKKIPDDIDQQSKVKKVKNKSKKIENNEENNKDKESFLFENSF
ncbi:MAG: exodeoxyribonuclease VII small subunit [Spirochaetes bacterium]|nr:exodeoxyribonuclease VII small subunit [Spirochaetota bacterium]